eukprot:358649-Chlamydomonas_euryale.AAC.7
MDGVRARTRRSDAVHPTPDGVRQTTPTHNVVCRTPGLRTYLKALATAGRPSADAPTHKLLHAARHAEPGRKSPHPQWPPLLCPDSVARIHMLEQSSRLQCHMPCPWARMSSPEGRRPGNAIHSAHAATSAGRAARLRTPPAVAKHLPILGDPGKLTGTCLHALGLCALSLRRHRPPYLPFPLPLPRPQSAPPPAPPVPHTPVPGCAAGAAGAAQPGVPGRARRQRAAAAPAGAAGALRPAFCARGGAGALQRAGRGRAQPPGTLPVRLQQWRGRSTRRQQLSRGQRASAASQRASGSRGRRRGVRRRVRCPADDDAAPHAQARPWRGRAARRQRHKQHGGRPGHARVRKRSLPVVRSGAHRPAAVGLGA